MTRSRRRKLMRTQVGDAARSVMKAVPLGAAIFAGMPMAYAQESEPEAPADEVGWHCDIDCFRMRQSQILHVADEIAFTEIASEARVEGSLLRHRRDGVPAVIMARIQKAMVG